MRNIIFIIIIIFITIILPPAALAKTNLNAAYSFNVVDKEAVDGDILIYTDKGLVRASLAFSTAMFGVKQDNPVVAIQIAESEDQPVVKTGVANVNVTSINGPIKKGDYITSSPVLGKGQKADKSGYMLGVALADFQNSEQKLTVNQKEASVGKIPVALDIKYVDLYSIISPAASKFLKSLDNILLASTEDPEKFTRLIRYVAAALIVIGAFVISFLTFSRSMANSVEAIGRNPLAKGAIYFSLLVNVVVAVISLAVGLSAAFILIKL